MLVAYLDMYDDNEWAYDDFVMIVEEELNNRKFPVELEAVSSNWRGQTGYADANSPREAVGKVASLNGSYIELHKGRGNSYYFKTATHDVPTGFIIKVNRKG